MGCNTRGKCEKLDLSSNSNRCRVFVANTSFDRLLSRKNREATRTKISRSDQILLMTDPIQNFVYSNTDCFRDLNRNRRDSIPVVILLWSNLSSIYGYAGSLLNGYESGVKLVTFISFIIKINEDLPACSCCLLVAQRL